MVAETMAAVLGAEVVAPEELPYTTVDDVGLIGFGSGIFYGGFHESLHSWIRGLPDAVRRGHPAFIFSTSGLPWLAGLWSRPLEAELARKGFDVRGRFHCRGFDTWGPLSLIGGINRGHPDAQDLARAAEFARRMAGPGAAASLHRAAG